MEASEKFPELDEGLEKTVIGYNSIIYSLYELRNSANNYYTFDPENYRKEIIKKYSKIYNCREQIIPLNLLEEVYGLDCNFVEKWVQVPDWFYTMYTVASNNYQVSNLGRIKINDTILLQEAYKDGYLVISNKNNISDTQNHSKEIYYFISAAFFGKPNGKTIHHINNNGYDCRPDNLILLTLREHSKVHGRYIKPDGKDK